MPGFPKTNVRLRCTQRMDPSTSRKCLAIVPNNLADNNPYEEGSFCQVLALLSLPYTVLQGNEFFGKRNSCRVLIIVSLELTAVASNCAYTTVGSTKVNYNNLSGKISALVWLRKTPYSTGETEA